MQERTLRTPLMAGGRTLDPSAQRLGWLTAHPPDTPLEILQRHYTEHGYLWLKGLIPRETILAFRQRYFTAYMPHGLTAPASDLTIAISNPNFNVTARSRRLDNQAVRWASYESLCLHPNLIEMFSTLLGGEVHLLKRKLLRRVLAGTDRSTPAHYDLTYIRGGTDQSLRTAWIPLGDIPVEMGGLVYLDGSDKAGRELEAELAEKNRDLPPEEQINAYNRNMREGGWITADLPALAEKLDTRWLMADYEAGDVVIHSPYMIHAATSNHDHQGRIRLSTDIRYQLVADPIDERWSQDWHDDDNL